MCAEHRALKEQSDLVPYIANSLQRPKQRSLNYRSCPFCSSAKSLEAAIRTDKCSRRIMWRVSTSEEGASPRGNRRRGHIICEIRRIRCETSQSQRTSRIHMWDAMGRMPHVYHARDSAGGIVERCGTAVPDHQKTHHEILAFLSDF